MHRVGVIGDLDSVIGFRGLGMTVVAVDDSEEAAKHIERLVQEDYAVIFITEALVESNKELLGKYKSARLPAIIPIPSIKGAGGIGMQQVRESVRKAVGIDLLGSSEESGSK